MMGLTLAERRVAKIKELKEKIFRMDGKINELTISNDTLRTVMKVKDELIKRLKGEGVQVCETCQYFCSDVELSCSKGFFENDGRCEPSKLKCNEWKNKGE